MEVALVLELTGLDVEQGCQPMSLRLTTTDGAAGGKGRNRSGRNRRGDKVPVTQLSDKATGQRLMHGLGSYRLQPTVAASSAACPTNVAKTSHTDAAPEVSSFTRRTAGCMVRRLYAALNGACCTPALRSSSLR